MGCSVPLKVGLVDTTLTQRKIERADYRSTSMVRSKSSPRPETFRPRAPGCDVSHHSRRQGSEAVVGHLFYHLGHGEFSQTTEPDIREMQ